MIPSASIDTVSSERSCWARVSSTTLWANLDVGRVGARRERPTAAARRCRSGPSSLVPARTLLNTARTLALLSDCRATSP